MKKKIVIFFISFFTVAIIASALIYFNIVSSIITPKVKTIHIYRYDSFSESTAQRLKKELCLYFPKVILEKEVIPLPEEYYNKSVNRYAAEGLLKDIKQYKKGDIALGLTDYVIYRPNEISKTYGIFGIGSINGGTCIVSSKKPKGNRPHTPENFTKLALHELGHAFGLPHCPDQHCYMVDAEHKMKLPQSHYFCENCKKTLKEKGWTLK